MTVIKTNFQLWLIQVTLFGVAIFKGNLITYDIRYLELYGDYLITLHMFDYIIGFCI